MFNIQSSISIFNYQFSMQSASCYILYAFYGFEFLDELLQAAGIVEHDGKRAVEESVVAIDADASQQDFLFLTYYISDVVDDANVVVSDDAKGDGILAAALSCPFRPNYSVTKTLAKLWRVGTILAMNLDASATCHEAENGIAINRLTAFCHLEVKTFQVLVDDENVRPPVPL